MKKSRIAAELRYKHPLSWFKNPENQVPSLEFLDETIRWFETGKGSRAFTPKDFLNLLFKQVAWLKENIYNEELVKDHFSNIPLSETQRHILTGFILKYWGGYPIRNADRTWERTLKIVEQLFLAGDPDSPEREFCKADMESRRELMQFGIAFTQAINHGLDVGALFQEMKSTDSEKQYKNFQELFYDAWQMEAVGPFANKTQFLASETYHEIRFNEWLMDFKGWIYGDEEGYNKFLNRSTIMDYLRYSKRQEEVAKNQFTDQKTLWRLDDTQPTTANVQAPIGESPYEEAVRKRLNKYKTAMKTEQKYEYAIKAISKFLSDRQEYAVKQIFIGGNITKQFCKALGDIWKDNFNEVIPLSYVKMCQRLFSILSKYEIDESDFKGKPPYKYFISAT